MNETKNEKNHQKQQDLLDQLLPAQIQLKEKVNRGKIQIERATVEVKLATNNVSRHNDEVIEAKANIDLLEQQREQEIKAAAAASSSSSSSSSSSNSSGGGEQLAASLVGNGAYALEYEEIDTNYRRATMDDTHVLEGHVRTRERCRERLTRIERELSEVGGARAERIKAAILKDEMSLATYKQAITVAEATIERRKNTKRTMGENSERAQQALDLVKDNLIAAEESFAIARAGSSQSARDDKRRAMVEQLKINFNGVIGTVIDLCEPVRDKFKVATLIALGKTIHSIVVDTKETAIACMEYLKNTRSGVAEFIPLESVNPTALNENLRSLGKGYNLAFDCMSFDDSLRPAILFAVGNTIICDDFNCAKKLRYQNNRQDYRVRAVTLTGQVIHKNMNITGGTNGIVKDRWNNKLLEKTRKKRDVLLRKLTKMERDHKMGIFGGGSSSSTSSNISLRDQMNQLDDAIRNEQTR